MREIIWCLLAVLVSSSQNTEVLNTSLVEGDTQDSPSSKADLLQLIRDFREFEEDVIIIFTNAATYALEHRLNMLKRVRSYFLGNGVLKPDSYLYARDVIQNFKIIKRFAIDWKYLHAFINGTATTDLDKDELGVQLDSYYFPALEELKPHVMTYLMHQKEAKIPAKEMADGNLPEVKSKVTLNSGDCFVIASFCVFDPTKLLYTLEWLREAHSRITDGSMLQEWKERMYSELAYTLSETGNAMQAFSMIEELVKTRDHNNFRMIELMTHFKWILKGVPVGPFFGDVSLNETSINYPDWAPRDTTGIVFQVCAGMFTVDPRLAAKLKCRFTTKNSSLFVLSPLKEEELHLNPNVMFYHNFITNSEIDKIMDTVYGQMMDSTVQNTSGSRKKSLFRASKTYFADREEFGLDSLDKRSETLVGLNSETEEQTQVVYYDAGGYYDAHYDMYSADFIKKNGNRMTTLLFYLNDVDAGGETVLYDLHVVVKPEKGGALVWDNTKRSGLLNEWAGHAACPVISGHKWIATKWFHYQGQMFHRPCTRFEHE